MSSQSCIDIDYDERDQRDSDDHIEEIISENDEETLTGDKESDKIYKIDRVDKNRFDERF